MPHGFVIAHGSPPAVRWPDRAPPEAPADAAPARRPGPVPGGRPLMADIARLAGVSVATVSRALAGDPMVRPSTRARITRIADALHYGVDEQARNLRRRQHPAVAVVLPPPAAGAPADPLALELLGSIGDALAAQGRPLLLLRSAVPDATALARELARGRAGGVLVVGQGRHHARLQAMAALGLPLAVWGAPVDGQAYATVGGDDLVGGRLATGHLLDRGARRVLFLGDAGTPDGALRHAGYLQAHRARGVPPVTPLPPCWPGPVADPAPLIAQALRQEPAIDAVCAGSDLLALAAVQVLRGLGRRVPASVLVTGHGDTVAAACSQPPLTSVAVPTAQAGAALVQALQAAVDGGPPSAVLLPAPLQVRASTAAGLGARRRGPVPQG